MAMKHEVTEKTPQLRPLLFGTRFLALGLLVAITNFGFFDRVELLYESSRLFTLAVFIGIWGLSLLVLLIAALQPSAILRMFWALLIGASSAAAYLYFTISGSDLSVFDAISLWLAQHEAHRAIDQYRDNVIWAGLLFAASVIAIALPPVPRSPAIRRWLNRLSWTPALPVGMIAAIVVLKAGGGSQALPKQFSPLAVSLVAVSKVVAQKTEKRRDVAIVPAGTRPVRSIVLLVDESVRADYLDLTANNASTPKLAAAAHRIVNFGPAVSGGNCSHYANAILRLGASRNNLVESIQANPTIWQYAKRAGFHTVYIDAQAGLNKNPGMLQNFMTVSEIANIDRFVQVEGVETPDLDFRLLEIVQRELSGDKPVFIYANKNGAHFPYDRGYRAAEEQFSPTIAQAGVETVETRINSYRNVIRWSVDSFFDKLLAETDLARTVVLYTSDHGQAFFDNQQSHCTVQQPDSREGLVPMFAITGNRALEDQLRKGALLNRERASHFALTPTILQIMGYDAEKVTVKFGASLFEKSDEKPAFTSGDIFGLFATEVNWTPIDLSADYLEARKVRQTATSPVTAKF
jgi:glucan phosphoethanolaminetransferase (alkaline phosphatase superfamily)